MNSKKSWVPLAIIAVVAVAAGSFLIFAKGTPSNGIGASIYYATSSGSPTSSHPVQTNAAIGISPTGATLSGSGVTPYQNGDRFYMVYSSTNANPSLVQTNGVSSNSFSAASGSTMVQSTVSPSTYSNINNTFFMPVSLSAGTYYYRACSGSGSWNVNCGSVVSFVIPQAHHINPLTVRVSAPISYVDNSVAGCPRTIYSVTVTITTPTGGVAPYRYMPSFGGTSTSSSSFSVALPQLAAPATRVLTITATDAVGNQQTAGVTVSVPGSHPQPCANGIAH